MDTRVERVDDTTVKLEVTVEPARVKAALEEAARHLAAEVNVPGFRKGRVPRRVLESRLGKGAVVQHAVQDSLPRFYSEALQEQELEPVGQPEFDLDTFEEGRDAAFTATVEVRPEFDAPAVDGVRVEHPEWAVTDEEIATELDRLRERFGEAETVDRPVQVGDLAVLSLSATHQGEPVDDASMDDQLYTVNDPEESAQTLDRELLGASPGTILKFSDTFEGDDRELDFTVIVKDVKVVRLPEADDDFAITASEFDTIEELRGNIAEQLGAQKLRLSREALRGRVVEAVAELVDVPLPRALVDHEVQFQAARLAREAERYGIGFEQYLQAIGVTADELQEQLQDSARQTVRAQLVVDRVGRDAGIEVSSEDLTRQLLTEAARANIPPDQLADAMRDSEQLGVLFTETFRSKTIDHILDRVEIVDAPPPELLRDADAADTADVAGEPATDADAGADAGTADAADTEGAGARAGDADADADPADDGDPETDADDADDADGTVLAERG